MLPDKVVAVNAAFGLSFDDPEQGGPASSDWERRMIAQWEAVIKDYATEAGIDAFEIDIPVAEIHPDGRLFVKTMSDSGQHDAGFWTYLKSALDKSEQYSYTSTRERGGFVTKLPSKN